MGLQIRRRQPDGKHGSSREPRRRLLRLARKGNRVAFTLLSREYFDLVTEYLVLSGYREREENYEKIDAILREAWRRLPYLNRLSDFERFIVSTLVEQVRTQSPPHADPLERRISELEPRARMALIARDMEGWSYFWLALALCTKKRDLADLLWRSRCRLLGISDRSMSAPVAICLFQISCDMDGFVSARTRKHLCQSLGVMKEAKEFKSRLLDFRCRLIELRQQIRVDHEQKDRFLTRMEDTLDVDEMIHPPLLDRLINLVNFRQFPSAALF